MFPDRRAKFRSDDTVEREADLVRRWGNVCQNSQFNIVNLIIGPLRKYLPFSLDINFSDPRLETCSAFVIFKCGYERATLFVRRPIWNSAEVDHDEAKFILAHEVGHLKMHRLDALGFSDQSESALKYLEEEERAEPQANKFADRLLVKESMVVGFRSADEVAEFFNVPLPCAQRRFDLVQDKRRRSEASQIGEACPECANFTLVRNGTCLKCDTCGSTTGCS